MERFQITPIENKLELHIIPKKWDLTEEQNDRLDQIWREEQENLKGYLFNGFLLSAESWDGHQMTGYFVEYKLYVAQLRDPEIKKLLRIKPVGVTGVTCAEGKVLVGQRSNHVAVYPGKYEFAPAGGVDDHFSTWDERYACELHEETGIPYESIKSIKPLAIFYDTQIETVDVVSEIQVEFMPIEKFTTEYQRLEWIPEGDLRTRTAQPGWVDLAQAISGAFY